MPFSPSFSAAVRRRWVGIEAALAAHPLAWACLLSALVAAVFALTLHPGYETNDDVVMQLMVGGELTEPSPHLVFSNVLIGQVLSSLYRAVGWFPWYGLYLYAAHFAALLAALYATLAVRRRRPGLRLLGLAGVLAVFHLPMWMQLQFTSTAILLGASGVMLFFAAAEEGPARWVPVVAGGTMVGLASWIRWHSGWAVIVLALAPLVATLRRANWRRTAAFSAIAGAVLLAGSLAQAAYYAGKPDWQAYFALNERRDHIQRTANFSGVDPAVLDRLGWSGNDLAMFKAWFFTDRAVFTDDDVETLADALPSTFRPEDAFADLAAQAGGWLRNTRLAVVAALGALAWAEGGRRSRAAVPLSSAGLLGAAFAVAGTIKLPDRVAVPMLAFLPLLFLVLPGEQGPGRPSAGRAKRAVRAVAALVSAVALVVGVGQALELDRRHHAAEAGLRETLSGLADLDPDGLFVAWGSQIQMSYGAVSPWRKGGLGGPALIGLGWQERSPWHEELLARHGITDLPAAVAARPDVYLPVRVHPREGIYLRYLEEHYGFSGLLQPAGTVGPYTVYDRVAAFTVEGGAAPLVERDLAGGTRSYPVIPAAAPDRAFALPLWPEGLLILGSAEADLVVATIRGEGVALAATGPAGPEGRHGFALRLGRAGESLRVFALYPDRAADITP